MSDAIGFDAQGNALPIKSVTKWLIINGNTLVWLNKEVRPYKLPGDLSARLLSSSVLRDAPFDGESPWRM